MFRYILIAYWPAREKPSAGRLTLFLGLFAAAMVMVVMARNGVLFLMAWEVMALSGYFLLDDRAAEFRGAAGRHGLSHRHPYRHHGAVCHVFAVARNQSAPSCFRWSILFPRRCRYASVIIITALIGFGGKAGLMPLHFWLPGAHANAPSHVSAMMSGVMLKMGVYGILRTLSFFDALPAWLGWLILLLGAWSAVNGIALAAGQRDLKRLLACSSIENIGIIFIGIGLALVGMQTATLLIWSVCGLFGAFIHIINHGLFKSLLFLGSGALIHGTGTREIDRMGGLARRMPMTVAALSDRLPCHLRPAAAERFCGRTVSLCRRHHGRHQRPVAAGGPGSAGAGTWSAGWRSSPLSSFTGSSFSVLPVQTQLPTAHEASALMTGPMLLLAGCCLIAGMAPLLLVRLVTPAVGSYGNVAAADTVAGNRPGAAFAAHRCQ